ncbi:MAG: hypothetical protein ABIV51_12055 [Saprospiraceae bacterium]
MVKHISKSLYRRLQKLAEITNVFIEMGRMDRASKCLIIAEQLFVAGNMAMKNIISNVYVFSVSAYMEASHIDVQILMPVNLNLAYYQQVNASGV